VPSGVAIERDDEIGKLGVDNFMQQRAGSADFVVQPLHERVETLQRVGCRPPPGSARSIGRPSAGS
jgi:hypothetical protein